MMKIVTRISIAMMTAMLLLAGCGTTGEVQKEDTGAAAAKAPDQGAQTAGAQGNEAAEAKPMETEKKPVNPLDDPNSLLSQRIVYFDYDSSTIRDDALAMIKAHGEYLAQHSNVSITLEGHCDERGTREYNIALGERRADAVRRMLMSQGVASSQIHVISYGEERPAKMGHNEDAWRFNRRVVFDYPSS